MARQKNERAMRKIERWLKGDIKTVEMALLLSPMTPRNVNILRRKLSKEQEINGK